MFDIKISVALIIADILLYLAGILFWFSSKFAHGLGVIGFFPRLFAGTVAMVIGLVITILVIKG
ncbi:hypothetical protein KY366_04710 [Candidatus Woesearchaeota archaeon]|nr:hypothetical protein [Candidatus Woesearchaeota archaeon]